MAQFPRKKDSIEIQIQSLNCKFLINVFKIIIEFSLILGCLYGFLMLLVEF